MAGELEREISMSEDLIAREHSKVQVLREALQAQSIQLERANREVAALTEALRHPPLDPAAEMRREAGYAEAKRQLERYEKAEEEKAYLNEKIDELLRAWKAKDSRAFDAILRELDVNE